MVYCLQRHDVLAQEGGMAMLDDADFERLGKLIDSALDRRMREVIAQEVRKVVDERVTAIIDQRVKAIVDERMQYYEARINRRFDALDKRLAALEGRVGAVEDSLKELRGIVMQMRDKQREDHVTLVQMWDTFKGLYGRNLEQDERLDSIERIIRRWGNQPPQAPLG
jgi:uncharacterized coiled-coil protein SlyX